MRKVPMNMVASATNYKMRPTSPEQKSLPKTKEKPTSSFEKLLKQTSKATISYLEKKTDTKPLSNENPDLNQLIALLPSLDEQLILLPDINEVQLLEQINILLEKMGIVIGEDLDPQVLADLSARLSELVNQNVNLEQPVIKGEIKPEVTPSLLVAGKTEFTQNQITTDETEKLASKVVKEVSTELVSNLTKQETKPRKSEDNSFRLDEDKVSLKTSNQKQTDIKKLINSEANRFNGIKVPTATSNSIVTEQPALNTNEEDVPSINVNKAEQVIAKTEHRLLETTPNNKPVEVKELIDQIVKKAELLLKQNSSEIKINLKPEFLGKMTIKIVVEEGIVTARFLTENHQVKHLLESNLNTLRQSLESQGIKVERTEVNVQLNNGGMFDGSENGRESRWERPEYLGNYQGNEFEEAFAFNQDLDWIDNQTDFNNYNSNEDGNLSFLI